MIPADTLALAEAIERGLPLEDLDLLREEGLTFTEMGAVIPHRTLKHRKTRGENLSVEETERAVRVASTIALAKKVFGNPDKAMRWLRGKDDRLGDRTPLSMLKTEAGGKAHCVDADRHCRRLFQLVVFWRISIYANLSGLGAEMSGGRWHTAAQGKRVVYLAEHPAVSLLENLVNLRRDGTLYPDTFQLLKITANEAMTCVALTQEQIACIDPEDLVSTQKMGDAWLAAGSSALLRVPSIPSPESWNYLLNPLHPEAALLTIEWARKIAYDRRLFVLAK